MEEQGEEEEQESLLDHSLRWRCGTKERANSKSFKASNCSSVATLTG